jgi:hypothetical protein
MGRGSMQQKQGRAASSTTAPTAAAVPAIPHEAAWRLLLGELWQPPEQQVVCRLLCCSRAMARLVHALCAGRLHVSMQPSERHSAPQRQTAYREAYCCWLAKHARLLAELRVQDVWGSQPLQDGLEQYVAAGLRAAAGVAVGGAAQRVTRAMTASQSAATRAAEAAAAAGPAAASAPQGLPLRSLVCDNRNSSASGQAGDNSVSLLLDSLAACPKLTRLQFTSWWRTDIWQPQRLAAALTALRGLRELILEERGYEALLPALQLGTQLTKLRLVGIRLLLKPNSLPASLVELACQGNRGAVLPPAGHLTALTRLQCESVDAGSSVPPSVQHLQLALCNNPAPLHHLTRLRMLDCGFTSCSLEQLQAAVAAIGPSLTSLEMWAHDNLRPALLSQRVSGPSLPLTGLTVNGVTGEQISVAHLGQWSGLTRLHLQFVHVVETPQHLAHQLQQLTALRELDLPYLRFSGAPQVSLQPLVDAVAGMRTLRRLSGPVSCLWWRLNA